MFNRENALEVLQPTLEEYISKALKDDGYGLSPAINFIDGFPIGKNFGGNSVDAEPFKGSVLFIDDSSIVIEQSKYVFFILDKSLVDKVPEVGDRVSVTPYFRKEFNGNRLNDMFRESTRFMDGMFIPSHGKRNDGITRIPGATIINADLTMLILNLQEFKLSDGYRSITDLLVTAGAKNFRVNDPTSSFDGPPPFIEFEVKTSKFKGKVKIMCVPSSNAFNIVFDGNKKLNNSTVRIGKLAAFFEENLQDEGWKKPRIRVLSKTK